MRKTFLVLCVITSFIFVSCEHKITVDLTSSEMTGFIEEDTLYNKVIDVVKKINDTLSKNQILYDKYSDITYEEIYDYIKEINDTTSEFNISIKDKKKLILSKYKMGIDEKINKYKDMYPGNFISIEFVGTDITFYEYINGVDDAYFKFKITSKDGKKINGCRFNYAIHDRTNTKIIETGSCKTLESFKDSHFGYWEIPYSYRDEFGYKSINKINEQYTFDFIPLSVNVDDKIYEINTDSISFTYKVLIYLKYKIDYSEYGTLKQVLYKNDTKDMDLYYLNICKEENETEYLKILDIKKEYEILNPKIFNVLEL